MMRLLVMTIPYALALRTNTTDEPAPTRGVKPTRTLSFNLCLTFSERLAAAVNGTAIVNVPALAGLLVTLRNPPPDTVTRPGPVRDTRTSSEPLTTFRVPSFNLAVAAPSDSDGCSLPLPTKLVLPE